ncbi:MAG: alpha/beta hydrolase [Streptosporangiaceae bacterium]
MRRLALAITGAAAGLVMMAATASSSVQAAAPSPPVYHQTIKWKPCPIVQKYPAQYRRLECARIKAPQDWHKPKGKLISLVVSRLKATNGNPRGAVFTNPGGPGGPGIQLPLNFIAAQRNKLLDNMDIIGLDPRGVGYSTQSNCKQVRDAAFGYDYRNRAKARVTALLRAAKKLTVSCQKGTGLPSRFNNTAQVMYDLDMIRRILRLSGTNAPVNRIDWIGYSAGTWMGAHYARYFPSHTGRFVLDSNTDFTKPWQSTFTLQPKGFERRFRSDFLPWVAKYNGTFHLGTTTAQVRAKYEKLRKVIVRKKYVKYRVTQANGTSKVVTYYPATLDNDIAVNLYAKFQFRNLAYQLAGMYRATPGAGARTTAAAVPKLTTTVPSFGDPDESSDATMADVMCNDTTHNRSAKTLVKWSNKVAKAYPLTGASSILDICLNWKRPKQALKVPAGKGLPRVLMVQSWHDPATPYELAASAHKRYPNSRLITVKNEGDHGIYAGGNACVDNAVESWIVDGVFPGNSTCWGTPVPGPNASLRTQDGLAQNPILRAQQLEDAIAPF